MTSKIKLTTATMTAVVTMSVFAPAVSVSADSIVNTDTVQVSNPKIKDYYDDLTPSDQQEFSEIVKGQNLSQNEQLEVLEQKSDGNDGLNLRWKTAVIKKIAIFLATKLGEKTVADITDYLFEWEDDLQDGIENLLISHGWNPTAAHWTAKTAMFIAF